MRSNEVIFNEIVSEFAEVDFQSTVFVRALVTVAINISLEKSRKLDINKFKKLSQILFVFINMTKEFELEALLAAQSISQKIKTLGNFY